MNAIEESWRLWTSKVGLIRLAVVYWLMEDETGVGPGGAEKIFSGRETVVFPRERGTRVGKGGLREKSNRLRTIKIN